MITEDAINKVNIYRYALEFLSILTPDTFIGIQGEDRDKHAVSFGDPKHRR